MNDTQSIYAYVNGYKNLGLEKKLGQEELYLEQLGNQKKTEDHEAEREQQKIAEELKKM